MCTASCRDLTSAPEGNASSCFELLITSVDFLLMDWLTITSKWLHLRLPSTTSSPTSTSTSTTSSTFTTITTTTITATASMPICSDLATPTLALMIGEKLQAVRKKLLPKTNQEVNEEKNDSSAPPSIADEGWAESQRAGVKKEREKV